MIIDFIMNEGKQKNGYGFMATNRRDNQFYISGFYAKKGRMERPGAANFTHHYEGHWS